LSNLRASGRLNPPVPPVTILDILHPFNGYSTAESDEQKVAREREAVAVAEDYFV
jgi:hypothetical protein